MPDSLKQGPCRNRAGVILSAGILAATLIAGVLCARSRCRSALARGAADVPEAEVRSWRVEVTGDGPQRLGGLFVPDGVLFAPAGAQFRVFPQPSNAGGMFVEDSRAATWDHEGGELNPPVKTSAGWQQECRAPAQPGLYRLRWQLGGAQSGECRVPSAECPALARQEPRAKSQEAGATLGVLVLTRAELQTRNGRTSAKVCGKSLGTYLEPAQSTVRRVRENAALYQPPQYFALLTSDTIPLKLGPDFELGQLVAFKDYHTPEGKKVHTTERHTTVFPPRPELIEKLVKLRVRLREKGVKVTRFWLTSAFRTPEYNRSIGGAAYSRHCFGDAVDLVIDEDGDKKMDDLNGDGKLDRKDGSLIGNACRELELEGAVAPGGIGVYEWDSEDSVRSHVHIDCRGYISRWGQVGAGRHKRMFTWWPREEFQEEESGE